MIEGEGEGEGGACRLKVRLGPDVRVGQHSWRMKEFVSVAHARDVIDVLLAV